MDSTTNSLGAAPSRTLNQIALSTVTASPPSRSDRTLAAAWHSARPPSRCSDLKNPMSLRLRPNANPSSCSLCCSSPGCPPSAVARPPPRPTTLSCPASATRTSARVMAMSAISFSRRACSVAPCSSLACTVSNCWLMTSRSALSSVLSSVTALSVPCRAFFSDPRPSRSAPMLVLCSCTFFSTLSMLAPMRPSMPVTRPLSSVHSCSMPLILASKRDWN